MDDSKAFDVIQDNLLLAKLKAYVAGERRLRSLRNISRETAESQNWGHLFQVETC